MGGNHGASRLGDAPQQSGGIDPFGQVVRGAEEKEIPVGGVIFHADEDPQTIGLKAFLDLPPGQHRMVVGDAHTVQTALAGVLQNLVKGQIAAGRNVAMNVQVEKHAPILSIILQIHCSDDASEDH